METEFMFWQVPSRERLGLVALGLLGVLGLGYLGSSAMRKPTPIEITPESTAQVQAPGPSGSVPPVAPSEIVVHVTGAVKKPLVAHLPLGARVEDAIMAAQGALPNADLDDLNLAAKLDDGSQVFVPTKGKPEQTTAVAPAYQGGPAATPHYSPKPAPTATTSRSSGPKHPSGPVSLNTATQAQLETLPGVGPSTAQKILDYRKEHGGFSTIDELMAVKGIGPKKLEKMREWLRL